MSQNGSSFDYALPGGALATFVWATPPAPARRAGPAGRRQRIPAGRPDPCCTGDVAANAVDDDAVTRYSTGVAQAAGRYLQIDLGRQQRLVRLDLDTGARVRDYDYTVTASVADDSWNPVGSAAGTGRITSVPLAGTPVRYLRVTHTASSGSWRSVADVRAYVPRTRVSGLGVCLASGQDVRTTVAPLNVGIRSSRPQMAGVANRVVVPTATCASAAPVFGSSA